MTILEIQNLAGGYNSLPAISSMSLSVSAGEWLSIIGANGSGKSTFLKLVCRILALQAGTIFLDGKEIWSQPARLVARKLSLLPQQQTIPQNLTVYQLVSLGRSPYQSWWQWELGVTDKARVEQALEQTQMERMSDRPVEQLSGGERQRAFLALSLAQDAKVLLLDEPTTYLDIRYQLELLELLKQLNQKHGLTLVTVLHDINLAARYSDRIALLKQGQLQSVGTPVQVLTPANLEEVFGVRVVIVETPVGLQICPLAPNS